MLTPLAFALIGGGGALAAAVVPWFVLQRGQISMAVLDTQLRKLFAAGNAPRARKLLAAGPHAVYMRCLAAAYDACADGDWPEAQRIAHARAAFNDRFRAEAAALSRRLPLIAVALAGVAVALWAVLDAGAPPGLLALPGIAAGMVLSVFRGTRRLARECPAYAEAIFPAMAAAIVAQGRAGS